MPDQPDHQNDTGLRPDPGVRTDPGERDDIAYVDAVRELEEILDELEADTVDVDALAARVRRAAALIELCRGRIEGARLEVEQIVTDLETSPARSGDDVEGGASPAPGQLL